VGSGVTLSGFNNIDFSSIVTALMKQASEPLNALQSRQDAIHSQLKAMGSLGNRVSALKTAADALADSDEFTAYSVTTGDSAAVTATTSSGAIAGHYDLVVQELARAQVTASASTAPDSNTTVVASGGSLTIGGTTVNITGNVTLTGLANAINATTDIGVAASVVRSGTGAYRLVLTSQNTGEDGAFTVTNALTGGADAVEFTDTDADGTTGDSAADNAVQATNARVLVNNVQAESSTNVFDEAVPGVKFTVLKKDAVNAVGLDVTADATAVKAKVTTFITAYNDLSKFMTEQNLSAGQGDTASIGQAPVLRQLKAEIRSIMLKTTGPAGMKNLSQAGVEFTPGGQLKLNEKVFTSAVENHADDFETLFTGSTGVFASLGTALKSYAGTGGFLSTTKDRMNDQVKGLDRQIANMQSRLALQRLALQQEFSATDTLMTSLKSQSSAMSGINSSMGLL
jgi:flagellar hook-associated protein 2